MKPVFLACISICAAVLAVPALLAESRAVLGAGHSQATRMQAMEQGSPTIALSIDSQRRVLLQCNNVMNHSDFAAAPQAQRDAVTRHCTDQIERALDRSPADGFLWVEQARLHLAQGDVVQMLEDVARSRALAPNEMWLAALRDQLVRPYEPLMTFEEYTGQNADFLVMAQSRSGVRILATRYLEDFSFRERITSLIETLPPQEQRLFLSNVRFVERSRRALQEQSE